MNNKYKAKSKSIAKGRIEFLLVIALALILAFVSTACSKTVAAEKENEGTATEAVETSKEEANAQETTSLASEITTSVIPDGYTERDFDIGYSDAITITLEGDTAESAGSGVSVDGSTVTISQDGTYLLKGTLNGQVVVNVSDNDGKVQLVLDGATITNETSAGIYIKSADKVFITTTDGSVNEVSTTGTFISTDGTNVDGAIFSKGNLVLNGKGSLNVYSAQGHGIVSKDDVKITSGTYIINTYSKGIQSNDLVGIAGGELSIKASEGIESTVVNIIDGIIDIYATDDGINATQNVAGQTPSLEIAGGEITIDMAAGDTDALDSNGYLYITGGTVNISAQFPFDYDYGGEISGGTVYVNGEVVTELYNAMMGGQGGGGWNRP